MKCLILCGSARESSPTTALLHRIEEALVARGVRTLFWNMALRSVPEHDPKWREAAADHPDTRVRDLGLAGEWADGIVIGSPADTAPAADALKNVLEHLGTRDVQGKLFALAVHGKPEPAGHQADELRTRVQGLQGVVIPCQVMTDTGDFVADADGYRLESDAVEARIQRLVHELLALYRSKVEELPVVSPV